MQQKKKFFNKRALIFFFFLFLLKSFLMMPSSNLVATPGSQSSPAPIQSPQILVSHHQRKDVAIVFIVDGSARMKPHLNLLYEAYVEPILK